MAVMKEHVTIMGTETEVDQWHRTEPEHMCKPKQKLNVDRGDTVYKCVRKVH
jgi:hypothetical protein